MNKKYSYIQMTTILANNFYRFTKTVPKKDNEGKSEPIIFEAKVVNIHGKSLNVLYYNDCKDADQFPTVRSIPLSWITSAELINGIQYEILSDFQKIVCS
jgi:hypothetical protein